MIVLLWAWLAAQLVGMFGLREPLGKLLQQLLAVPFPCLTRWP